MPDNIQMNLRLPKIWRIKLDLIAKKLQAEFKDPNFNTQDLIKLTLAEKFNLTE